MNGPSTDENDNITDVFVLSRSDTDAPVRPEHLEPKGYRVTLFSDSQHLLETLQYGKPNLLVCDSLSLGPEAYDVCRQIKADAGLWMIPVLVITTSTNLSDLLQVLDCNADNFIASPFDVPYLISLIEGMLTTPVEQPTPEQIKTQFRIQHDDQLFVVTADRRRLLEFLLSSFEIAVNKTAALDRAGTELISLSKQLEKSSDQAVEQTRINSVLNGTLQDREETISKIDDELKGAARQIRELSREKEFFIAERNEDRARIAALEESNRGLMQEKETTAASHRAEAEDLRSRIGELDADLAIARSDLQNTRGNLERTSSRCQDAEGMLAELVPAKERTEKALQALILEHEQVKNTCASEKNRAHAAEQETRALLAAKAEAETDLTRIITDLKETAKQQAAELATLRNGRTADGDRIASLEARVSALISEKDTLESGLRKAAAGLKADLDMARSRADESAAGLEKKSHEITRISAELANEQKSKEQAAARAAALESELSGVQSALDAAREEHAAAVASLESALRERDAALSGLRGAHDEVRTDLVAHRDDLSRTKQDLALITEERNTLRSRLDAMTAQTSGTEAKLLSATAGLAEADKQIRSLSEEHEQLIAALDAERRQRRIRDDELHATARAGEKTGGQLELVRKEMEQLGTVLNRERKDGETARAQAEALQKENERLEHLLSEERSTAKQSLDVSESRICAISSELATASQRVKELENTIGDLEAARSEAETRAASYAAEIDQARTALADEWEDHMTDNERHEAASRGKEKLQRVIPLPPISESGTAITPMVITRKTELPVAVHPGPSAITVMSPQTEELSAPSDPVEELYEDASPAEVPDEDLPSVSIVRDTAPQVTIGDYSSGIESGDLQGDEDDALHNDGGDDNTEVLAASGGSSPFARSPIAPAFSFNRTQWFDLLKWAHHSGSLSQDQRLQIVRMGRLIQKGRRLTNKQDEQVREILSLVHSLGYRFS